MAMEDQAKSEGWLVMDIKWNPDADRILGRMVDNVSTALDGVSREYAGRPIEEVRSALAARWAAANEGASEGVRSFV
jgi:hypothetical protein